MFDPKLLLLMQNDSNYQNTSFSCMMGDLDDEWYTSQLCGLFRMRAMKCKQALGVSHLS